MSELESIVCLVVIAIVGVFVAQVLRSTLGPFAGGGFAGLAMLACYWIGRKVEK